MKYRTPARPALAAVMLMLAASASAEDIKRISNLYDAFGAPSALTSSLELNAFTSDHRVRRSGGRSAAAAYLRAASATSGA